MRKEIKVRKTRYEFVVPISVKGDDIMYSDTTSGNIENENTELTEKQSYRQD